MGYPLGDNRNELAGELGRILQNLSNAAAAGDVARFRQVVSILTAWLDRNGYGQATGQDLNALGSYGQNLGKSASDALGVARSVSDGLTVAVQKGLGGADGVESGVYCDQVLSSLLVMTAEHLAKSEGLGMSDALCMVAKSCPELAESNARASSNTSRAYWAYVARTRRT